MFQRKISVAGAAHRFRTASQRWSARAERRVFNKGENCMLRFCLPAVVLGVCVVSASAAIETFDSIPEGFLGTSYNFGAFSISNVNNNAGVFPDGSTFGPADVGEDAIIENAALLYNDFPDFGSAANALTFGNGYIPGDNLSLGAISQATFNFAVPVSSVMFQMAYYELGPWSGIEFHLDGFRNGSLVTSDAFTIAGGDLNERDQLAFEEMRLLGATIDSMRLYATYNGSPSAPRILVDNLEFTVVPEPATLALLAGGVLLLRRRR
jgi:hypothetical protein